MKSESDQDKSRSESNSESTSVVCKSECSNMTGKEVQVHSRSICRYGYEVHCSPLLPP